MPRLEEWSIICRPANGGIRRCLTGKSFGDPRFPPEREGDVITTSPIAMFSSTERIAMTMSGTRYELGEIDVYWALGLKVDGISLSTFDQEGPF